VGYYLFFCQEVNSFVFGQRAFDEVIDNSMISPGIKKSLRNAIKYFEGRGIRINLRNSSNLSEIQELIKG
jgi:hypothetical protein